MNITGHFKTITRHRHLVMKNCFKAGIPINGLLHDLSKYSPAEFIPGIMNYEEGKRSPNEHEREVKGYSSAWLHHKGRNKHHFEYWFDISTKTKQYEPLRMPLCYLKETFCDRVAACKIYKGENYKDSDPLEYYLSKRPDAGYSLLHPCTACILEKWLRMLATEGEKATFDHIRKIGEIKYCTFCPRRGNK